VPNSITRQPWGGSRQEVRLLTSLFSTYLGSSITATASTIFLVQRFGVGGASGLALVLQLVPNLLLGPVAGEVVSRVNPKLAAMAGSIGVGVAVLGYLLITQAWQAQLVSLAVGIAGVIGTPARMSLRAAVLSTDRLKSSTGAIVAAERLGLVLGPLIATTVAVAIGVQAAFVLEFFLALVAITTLAGLHPRESDRGAPTENGLRGVYRRAWQLMTGDRIVWEYSLSGFVYLIGVGIRRLLFPAALIVTLNSSENRLGILVGAMAVGGIVGGLIAPRVDLGHVDRQFVLQTCVEMLIWVALGFAGSLPVYLPLLVIAGVLEGFTTTLYFIRVQDRLAPKEIGRYFSLMSPMSDASIVVGVLIASWLGLHALANYGFWIIAALIGGPLLICPVIVHNALTPTGTPQNRPKT